MILGSQMRKILEDNPQLQGSLSTLRDGNVELKQNLDRFQNELRDMTSDLNGLRRDLNQVWLY